MNTDTRPQQLTLLPKPEVPVQFRLDEATRRRGLRHVAEIRLQLEQRRAERAGQPAAERQQTAA
jgi:hypothetical protein